MQKILIMQTEQPRLRSENIGFSAEDGDLVQLGAPIGRSTSPNVEAYATPLHAIGDGWELLAPPVPFEENRQDPKTDQEYTVTCYEWWLTKD